MEPIKNTEEIIEIVNQANEKKLSAKVNEQMEVVGKAITLLQIKALDIAKNAEKVDVTFSLKEAIEADVKTAIETAGYTLKNISTARENQYQLSFVLKLTKRSVEAKVNVTAADITEAVQKKVDEKRKEKVDKQIAHVEKILKSLKSDAEANASKGVIRTITFPEPMYAEVENAIKTAGFELVPRNVSLGRADYEYEIRM